MVRKTDRLEVLPVEDAWTEELYPQFTRCTVEKLKEVLDAAALKHKGGLFHYTTLGRLKRILTGRKLFLTHPSYLNDRLEAVDLKDTMYLACFGFGREENIGMWGNYGRPREEAVRVQFPFRAIKKRVELLKLTKKGVYAVRTDDGRMSFDELEQVKIRSVLFHDVGYVGSSGKSVEHCRSYYSFAEPIRRKEGKGVLSSYIKKHGWAYEHEVRLVIQLDRMIKNDDGTVLRNLAVEIGDVIDAVKEAQGAITVGPWFDTNPYKSLDGLLKPTSIKFSEYTGMVDLPCESVRADNANCDKAICFNNCTFNIH